MSRWGNESNAGKGDSPRNVGKLFKKNYDDINWGKKTEPKDKSKDKSESV